MTIKPKLSCPYLLFVLLFLAAASTSSAQKIQKLDSLFTTLYNKGGFNGCVLVAEEGNPIYQKAFGYADFATKRPLDNSTIFELASVSKQFTAMAIMQLHQAGKLKYDDSLKKYFPNLQYPDVTINNLLHHTSGIPDFLFWGADLIDQNRFNYNADILASVIKSHYAPRAKPGEQFGYSNTNYVLLALIVEKVSGMPFGKYLEKHIFKPLGMTSTSVYTPRAAKKKIKNYAFGHMYSPALGRFVISDSIPSLRYEYYLDGTAGHAGISSNTVDMLKWDQALYTDKLVSKEEQALAYVPEKLNNGQNAQLGGLDYGFGWMMYPKGKFGNIYMHSGGYPGYYTIIYRLPDTKKTIIILTNTWDMANMYLLGTAIIKALFDQPFVIPDAPVNKKGIILSTAQLKAIEGTYKIDSLSKLTITDHGGQAYARMNTDPRLEIYPLSETAFVYTIAPATINFEKDAEGKVTSLTLIEGQSKRKAEKIE